MINGDTRASSFTCNTFATGNKSWVDGGEVWIQDHPDVKQSGKTYITYTKPNVKDFYVFLPNSEEWKSAEPHISETYSDGKTKDVMMYNDGENCGWYYRRYVDEPLPTSVIIHRDDDEAMTDAIGMNGAWEELPWKVCSICIRQKPASTMQCILLPMLNKLQRFLVSIMVGT